MLPIRSQIIRGLLWQVEIDAKNSRTGQPEPLTGWAGSCLLRSRETGFENWTQKATVTITAPVSGRVLVSLPGSTTSGIAPGSVYGLVKLIDPTGEAQPFRMIDVPRVVDESELG